MTSKKKLVFNLSLKDLKDLGILKKKKRKRKSHRKKKVISSTPTTDAVKSISSHMPPYAFMNMNNLQAENLRLQNQALEEKKQSKQSDSNELVVSKPQIDRYQALEDKFNEHKLKTDGYIGQGVQHINTLYNQIKSFQPQQNTEQQSRDRFTQPTSNSIDDSNILRTDTFTDNVDVGATSGDDTFTNALGIPTQQLQEDEIKEKAKDSGDSQGGEGENDGMGGILDESSDSLITEVKNLKNHSEQLQKEMDFATSSTLPTTSKPIKISKKIGIPENVTSQKKVETLISRKQAYINLMKESGQKPDKQLLKSGTLGQVNYQLRTKFKDYYGQNISKKK